MNPADLILQHKKSKCTSRRRGAIGNVESGHSKVVRERFDSVVLEADIDGGNDVKIHH